MTKSLQMQKLKICMHFLNMVESLENIVLRVFNKDMERNERYLLMLSYFISDLEAVLKSSGINLSFWLSVK